MNQNTLLKYFFYHLYAGYVFPSGTTARQGVHSRQTRQYSMEKGESLLEQQNTESIGVVCCCRPELTQACQGRTCDYQTKQLCCLPIAAGGQ